MSTGLLLPGDVGLMRNNNPAGWAIRVGDGIWAHRHHVPAEPFNHAMVYEGDGLAVQGEPGGANTTRVHNGTPGITWFRHPGLTDTQRAGIAKAAHSLIGTPYNWLDILALGLDCLGWDVQRDNGKLTWIGRRISSVDKLVCSALVDKAYADAGVRLFDDGRLVGEVSPADLARCPKLVKVP